MRSRVHATPLILRLQSLIASRVSEEMFAFTGTSVKSAGSGKLVPEAFLHHA